MVSDKPVPTRPRALSLGHFRPISVNGFGDGRNAYSWSACWYKDHLYVGANRNVMVIAIKLVPAPFPSSFFPVPIPPGEASASLDNRGQVWRYNPRTGEWRRVFRSPQVPGLEGRTANLATGFRCMAVFQGKSDPEPAIYTVPGCGTYGLGPVLLRCVDGEHFEQASEPGLGLGDVNVVSYRGAVPFKGRLFIAPAAARGGANINTSNNLTVLCSDDPARGGWEVSNPERFGDPDNNGIFEMAACGNFLYAGTINIRRGLQLWKTDGEGPPPHRWTKVLDQGADRGNFNMGVACMTAFRGALYVGTGIQGGGYDRVNNIGPAGAEILCVYPDDTWDLVMGEPRMTRSGFRVPRSGLGPGFDNPCGGYVWRLREHDGVLYAGTFDSAAIFPFVDRRHWVDTMQRLLDDSTLERFIRMRAGADLWRSADGTEWTPVTRNGFGNPFNWGIRTLLSTPAGLVVGTANPYGPQVAVRGPAGWRYEPNPRGGTEVWLGSPDHAGFPAEEGNRADCLVQDPWSGTPDAIPYAYLASLVTPDAPGPVVPDEVLEHRQFLHGLADSACPEDALARHHQFAIAEVEAETEEIGRFDPVRGLAEVPAELVGLSEGTADEIAAYYGGPLHTVGYWRQGVDSPRRAGVQLLTELLAFLPAPADGEPPENILAVAENPDALAEALAGLRPAARVVPAPAGMAREGRSGSQGHGRALESPTILPGGGAAAWDVVVWVEGPSTADREAALLEAYCRLRPGGRLLAADLLGTPSRQEERPQADTNLAGLIRRYERDLGWAGFVGVRIEEVTRLTWDRFFQHSREFFAAKLLFQQLDRDRHAEVLAALPGGNLVAAAYVLVSALKPQGEAALPGPPPPKEKSHAG